MKQAFFFITFNLLWLAMPTYGKCAECEYVTKCKAIITNSLCNEVELSGDQAKEFQDLLEKMAYNCGLEAVNQYHVWLKKFTQDGPAISCKGFKKVASAGNTSSAKTPAKNSGFAKPQYSNLKDIEEIEKYIDKPIGLNKDGGKNEVSKSGKDKITNALKDNDKSFEEIMLEIEKNESNKKTKEKEGETVEEEKSEKPKKCESSKQIGQFTSGNVCIPDNGIDGNCNAMLNYKITYLGRAKNIYDECYDRYKLSGTVENNFPNKFITSLAMDISVKNCIYENMKILKPDTRSLGVDSRFGYICEKSSTSIIEREFSTLPGEEPIVLENAPFENGCTSHFTPIELKTYKYNIYNKDGVTFSLTFKPLTEPYDNYLCRQLGPYEYYVFIEIFNSNKFPVEIKVPDIKVTGWDAFLANGDSNSEFFVGYAPLKPFIVNAGSKYSSDGKAYSKNSIKLSCLKEPKLKSINWQYGYIKLLDKE